MANHHRLSNPAATNRTAFRAALLLAGVIATGMLLSHPAARNLAFRQALRAVLLQPANYRQATTILEPLRGQDCRVGWQTSLLLRKEDPEEAESGLNDLLECTPASVGWLFLMAPKRADLAARAVELYPQKARAWLWLGDVAKSAGESGLASQYYSESLRREQTNGLTWCRLGFVNEQQELLQAAKDAFRQCCKNGDPGGHGCYGAGRMAEKLGDIPAAISYYELSHFPPALQRADELAGKE